MRKSLTRLEGVSDAVVDRQTGTAVVTYDPARVDIDEMTKATTNAGFPSSVQEESRHAGS